MCSYKYTPSFSGTYGLGRVKPDQLTQKSPHHTDDINPAPYPQRTVRLERFSSHPSSAGPEAMRPAGSSPDYPHTVTRGYFTPTYPRQDKKTGGRGGTVLALKYAQIFYHNIMFCELLFLGATGIFSQFPVFGYLPETSSHLDFRSTVSQNPRLQRIYQGSPLVPESFAGGPKNFTYRTRSIQ